MVIFSIFSKSGKKVETIFYQTVLDIREKSKRSGKKVKIRKKIKRSGKKVKNNSIIYWLQIIKESKIISEKSKVEEKCKRYWIIYWLQIIKESKIISEKLFYTWKGFFTGKK